MVAARAVTARPDPTEAASADVPLTVARNRLVVKVETV
jgi:hypothetical protein